MKSVLTLVVPAGETLADAPGAETRAEDAARAAAEKLRGAGAAASPPERLGRGAWDLPFDAPDPSSAAAAAAEDLRERGLDSAVQPLGPRRRRRLLVADMESTVIENEMLDELAERVDARQRVAEITARAMNGELDFEAALAERVGLLKGLPATVIDDCRAAIRIDPGARVLVATLKAHGARAALVSGGFVSFAQRVADELGFDECRANRLEIRDGLLTGRTAGPVLDKGAKVQSLDRLCGELGIERAEAVTVGDGANDLPMLQAAGLGVSYRGKPAVAAAAPYRIEFGDLSTLLFYLGFHESSFVH
ncbi:MAG: phosphoserine phosphatase SerB [Acidobacteriota bacterium]